MTKMMQSYQFLSLKKFTEHVWTCSNMSKLVQIQYDTNCYNSCDSQTCLNMFKHVQTCSDSIWHELIQFMRFSKMSEHVETCLKLFRFNMILWIVTIYMILNHVWTCSNKHVLTCSDSIWYKLLQFMRFSNMSEHVETCLNLFRFNMIWIVTILMILKHVRTCSNKHV